MRRPAITAMTAAAAGLALLRGVPVPAAVPTPVPIEERGTSDAERSGFHDANNIRTVFWNFGMVGDYPPNPGDVDLSVFHSVEAPKGSGMNYSDGITPFVLTPITQRDGSRAFIMETGFRERQGQSPYYNRQMRFEPRPGYFEPDPVKNRSRSPAVSNDSTTWPENWPDKLDDLTDPGWPGSWNGYFGKQVVADEESFTVMDDEFYDAFDFIPDSRDSTRRGLGLRVEVRGFQWANPQARNVIFWHYDITNEGTADYDSVVFGLYMDSGVGGSALSCDGIYESDDDNAYFDRLFGADVLNLVYTWDNGSHGRDLASSCSRTGYLGYAYMETPGNPLDGLDNDSDGATDERRDGGPGEHLTSAAAIDAHVDLHYNRARFEATYGPVSERPAYVAQSWWTGDEDMDWVAASHDLGVDGLAGTGDTGEGDGTPTEGEPSFDRTDLNESDQIGLTGFKYNRIKAGQGSAETATDNILFFTTEQNWPERLYTMFTDPDSVDRFDTLLASNYNIGFLFASGPFQLKAGRTERFSLALAYGGDLGELRRTVKTVRQIYDANYRFAVPPPLPRVAAEAGDGFVRLSWDNAAELGADPVTGEFDFEGYRIYRATDPEFRDPQIIYTGTGSGPIGNGRPIAQFDLENDRSGYSTQSVEGVSYYLGSNTGLTHTWTDSTVTNGQLYYYAVTAYDYGSEVLDFYPSENAITVSRTPRGGLNLPRNAVAVRPDPRPAGYVPASTEGVEKVAGRGDGSLTVDVVSSGDVADDHWYKLVFGSPSPDSIRATAYALIDSTTGDTLLANGDDFKGLGTGPTGGGLLPVVFSAFDSATVDTAASGFTGGSPTDAALRSRYVVSLPPVNLARPGFPDDISIIFHDAVVDTGVPAIGIAANPAKFEVIAHAPAGDVPLDVTFNDLDADGTISMAGEFIRVLTYTPSYFIPGPWATFELDVAGGATITSPPAEGDRYEIVLRRPLMPEDVFVFRGRGESIDRGLAASQFDPYVVPNPYVGAASFEPGRFAVSGRGERRIEFRGLPARCTIRIFDVRGDAVATLEHDDPTTGYEPWNLRTRDNLELAPGLYIFHVEAPGLGSHTGKFAIIK